MRILLLPLAAMVVLAPFAKAQDWSSWKADDTYRGIEVRTRCTGYDEFAGRYLWDVQLRNRYKKRVDVIGRRSRKGCAAQRRKAMKRLAFHREKRAESLTWSGFDPIESSNGRNRFCLLHSFCRGNRWS
jgi:hypothetical protein